MPVALDLADLEEEEGDEGEWDYEGGEGEVEWEGGTTRVHEGSEMSNVSCLMPSLVESFKLFVTHS